MPKRSGCLILVLLLLGAVVLLVWRDFGSGGGADHPVEISIPQGTTLNGAAHRLAEAGAIRSARGFLRYAKLFGPKAPIKAGDYLIPAHSSAEDILTLLESGKTLKRLVTIPEGLPSILVYERLNAEQRLSGTIAVPQEGSVLPDSYSFEIGDTRASVLKRMQDAMCKELAELWAHRKPTTVVKSPQEAITLASIVEKETAKASERRIVAAVYSNRLKIGMRLQADPTVIYPITKGKPLGHRIRRSELTDANPYNTYAVTGLPPGPIANPSRESIEAVLDPAPSKAIYFVADGTGGHVFADTLEQHNANVKKWYAIRRARGEM